MLWAARSGCGARPASHRAGPFAEHQVAFPMTRHRPVSRLRGPLADVARVAQLPTSLRQPLAARIAHRPARPQAALQLATQRAAALDEQRQVDRLVRHPHHQVLPVGQRQPAGNLLRRPPQRQLGLHRRPQPRLGHQLGRLGPLRPPERSGVSNLSPVAVSAAVTGQLPRHRRWCSPQPGRDLPARLADGHAAADLLPFGHAERPLRPARGTVLHPAGLEYERSHRWHPLAEPRP
jgi:hypothetical protein